MSEYFSGDPREIGSEDEYAAANSGDSADEREIAKLEMELLRKREMLKNKKKPKTGPQVVVPGSPKKNRKAPEGSTEYFQQLRNEEMLKEKIAKEKATKQANKASSFADRFILNKKNMAADTQKKQEILATKVYSFLEGQTFKSIKENCDEKEKYSGLYISERYLKSDTVAECMAEKKVMRIEKVLAEISPPEYAQPDYANWVVLGVIISKNEAKTTSNSTSRYVTLNISNFKQKLPVVLMGKAVEKYYKLRIGDVVAVLNPSVWAWKERDINGGDTKHGFSLALKDDFDAILEIGRSRDFGYCTSRSRDGTQCKTAIDRSKTEVCDYHRENALKKTTARRMEFNTTAGVLPPKMHGQTQHMYLSSSKKGLKGQLVGDSFLTTTNTRVVSASDDPNSAFFNERYQSPTLLSDAQRDLARVRSKKKELALRRKLVGMVDGYALKDASIENKEEKLLKSTAEKVAFSSTTLNKIGFNPTRRVFEKADVSGKRAATVIADELKKEISTNKVLTPTEEAIKKRKRDWKQNIEELKRSKEAPKPPTITDDSDSDLEIEPPYNPDKMAEYVKITGK